MADKKSGWKLPKVDLPTLGLPKAVRDASVIVGDSLKGGVDYALGTVRGTLDSGFGLLRATIGGIPFLGLTTTSDVYDSNKVDEKHYFLIEDHEAEHGYTLFVLRCLPDGVPPINDLPKRRLLHLPSEDALPMLQHIVTQDARTRAEAEQAPKGVISHSLDSLIDEIDAVDQKVFGGALAIGGLVALANPLAGAAIAAKALVPSVGLIAAKYGLKAASRTATNLELSREIRRVEKDVVRQFKSADTLSMVNPILHHLGSRIDLSMWMMKADAFEFAPGTIEFTQNDVRRLCGLTLQALRETGVAEYAFDYAADVASIVGGSSPNSDRV